MAINSLILALTEAQSTGIMMGVMAAVILILLVIKLLGTSYGDQHVSDGYRFMKEGDYDKAAFHFEKAIKSGKFKKLKIHNAYEGLAETELYRKNYDRAAEKANEALLRHTEDSAAYNILGRVYSEQGDSQKAVEMFLKQSQIKEDTDCYVLLAFEYARLGDEKQANIAVNNAQRLKHPDIKEMRKDIKRILNESKRKASAKQEK